MNAFYTCLKKNGNYPNNKELIQVRNKHRGHFSKQIQIANNYMKKMLSLANREIKIKALRRCHVRVAIMRKTKNTETWRGNGEKRIRVGLK